MNEIDTYIDSLRRSEKERRAAVQKVRGQWTEFLKSYANDVCTKSSVLRIFGIEVSMDGDELLLQLGAKFVRFAQRSERVSDKLEKENSKKIAIGFVEFENVNNINSEKLTKQIVDHLVKSKWITL